MPPELETSYIPDDPHPDKPLEDIAAISELITSGDADKSEPQQEAEPEQQPPEALEIAEAEPEQDSDEQQAEPEQVDYDQVVPMPDGKEALTVGQLKDHYQDTQDLQQERSDWEVLKSEEQLGLMATRRQLVELADMLQDVKPEVIDHVQQMIQRDHAQEAELLLKTFPEWADADKKAAARTGHLKTMEKYGFSEWEYSGIEDYRFIVALNRLTILEAREAAGKVKREQLKADLPKGQKPQPRKQSTAQARAATIQRAKRGTETEKISAISSLISEG